MEPDDLTLIQLLTRMDARLARHEEDWRFVVQRLDRTDATHAGISRTLFAMGMTLERQTQVLERQTQVFETLLTTLEHQTQVLEYQSVVLERLETTLDRWLAQHNNGQTL